MSLKVQLLTKCYQTQNQLYWPSVYWRILATTHLSVTYRLSLTNVWSKVLFFLPGWDAEESLYPSCSFSADPPCKVTPGHLPLLWDCSLTTFPEGPSKWAHARVWKKRVEVEKIHVYYNLKSWGVYNLLGEQVTVPLQSVTTPFLLRQYFLHVKSALAQLQYVLEQVWVTAYEKQAHPCSSGGMRWVLLTILTVPKMRHISAINSLCRKTARPDHCMDGL